MRKRWTVGLAVFVVAVSSCGSDTQEVSRAETSSSTAAPDSHVAAGASTIPFLEDPVPPRGPPDLVTDTWTQPLGLDTINLPGGASLNFELVRPGDLGPPDAEYTVPGMGVVALVYRDAAGLGSFIVHQNLAVDPIDLDLYLDQGQRGEGEPGVSYEGVDTQAGTAVIEIPENGIDVYMRVGATDIHVIGIDGSITLEQARDIAKVFGRG